MSSSNSSSSSVSSNDSEDEQPERRGVRQGIRRGKYNRSTENIRQRIIDAANRADDWAAIAAANGVKKQTAYTWVKQGTAAQKHRGGLQPGVKKLTDLQIDEMLEWLSDNPQLTLREIVTRTFDSFHIRISNTTVSRYLDGRLFTTKKPHLEPQGANNVANKALRKTYVENVTATTGQGKFIAFVDESNVNLFIRRNIARARRGARATVKLPNSKGPNIHMVAALTQTGLIHFVRQRGSFKSHNFNNWLRQLITTIITTGRQPQEIAIVIDNAPSHSKAEEVVNDFPGVIMLRLAPYSPMLNPIEGAWNAIKFKIKTLNSNRLPQLLLQQDYGGLTQTEYRLRFVEQLIDESKEVVTPMMCLNLINHTHTFYADALAEQDIRFGI